MTDSSSKPWPASSRFTCHLATSSSRIHSRSPSWALNASAWPQFSGRFWWQITQLVACLTCNHLNHNQDTSVLSPSPPGPHSAKKILHTNIFHTWIYDFLCFWGQNLGVTIWLHPLTLRSLTCIKDITKSSNFHLKTISRLSICLFHNVAESLDHTFIPYRLDTCNNSMLKRLKCCTGSKIRLKFPPQLGASNLLHPYTPALCNLLSSPLPQASPNY